MENDKKVLLGRISTVYGVKGWLKVTSHTKPRENIFNYPVWQLKVGKQWQSCQVESGRPQGKTLVVKLEGLDDRDEAAKLIGSTIAVYRSQLPDTEDGEHYWSDLFGMDVKTSDDKLLGQVSDILETGSNDVLVVRQTVKGKRVEHLIPWLDDVIKAVQTENKLILVDWDPDF